MDTYAQDSIGSIEEGWYWVECTTSLKSVLYKITIVEQSGIQDMLAFIAGSFVEVSTQSALLPDERDVVFAKGHLRV
jgi:hypothetical protein